MTGDRVRHVGLLEALDLLVAEVELLGRERVLAQAFGADSAATREAPIPAAIEVRRQPETTGAV